MNIPKNQKIVHFKRVNLIYELQLNKIKIQHLCFKNTISAPHMK